MARAKKDLNSLTKTVNEGKKQTKVDVDITCFECSETKSSSDFYQSYGTSGLNVTHICKDCVVQGCLDEDGEYDLVLFQRMLQKLDKPFLNQIYISTVTKCSGDVESIVGNYMKNIHMKQYRGLTFANSDMGKVEELISSVIDLDEVLDNKERERLAREKIDKASKNGKLSAKRREELIDKWGKYTDELLAKFERKFDKLSRSYNILTELHMESLIDYVRLQVLYEYNLENDNAQQAEKFKKLADESKKSGKLSVLQLGKDLTGNSVDSFGEMVRLVSKKNGVLKLPLKFIIEANDEIDYAIYQFISYERQLRGMPIVKYEDIYEWYTKDIEKWYASRNEEPKYNPKYIK